MRTINLAVWHCSADEAGVDHPLDYYDKMHREKRGFRKVGYHIIIHPDGSVEFGREIWEIGAHAKGYNRNSIGIMYVGGLEKGSKTHDRPNGTPKDTRTPAQRKTMKDLKRYLDYMYSGIKHVGHRDLSVDLNGDGVISPGEWMKACPCFDVATEL